MEYLEEKKLKDLVKKHSEFIGFPIELLELSLELPHGTPEFQNGGIGFGQVGLFRSIPEPSILQGLSQLENGGFGAVSFQAESVGGCQRGQVSC